MHNNKNNNSQSRTFKVENESGLLEFLLANCKGDSRSKITANLKYKQPDGGVQSIEMSHVVTADKYTVNLSDDEKLILSLIEFALYGRSSPYKGTADLNRAISRIENLDFDGDEVKQSVVDVIRMYQRLEEDRIQGH